MDKVISCLEHIQFLLRAIGGRITNEQIQLLLVSDDLDEDEQQKKRLFELLEENKIFPISEEELHPKAQASNVPAQPKVERNEDDKELRNARCKEHFESLLKQYKNKLKEKPNLAKLFEIEKPFFVKSVIEQSDKKDEKPYSIIAMAGISISRLRKQEQLKNGWICGTYLSREIQRFELWVSSVFTEEQQSVLIRCIVEGKELTAEQNDMIDVILYNVPGILVHQRFRRSDFLDD